MTDLLKSVISKAKEFVQLAKLIPKLKTENGNLQMELAELKIAHADLQTEIAELQSKLTENTNNPLSFNGKFYQGADGYPYCPTCYNVHRIRNQLTSHTSNFTERSYLRCHVRSCNFSIKVSP